MKGYQGMKKKQYRLLYILVLILTFFKVNAQQTAASLWADSLLSKMTLDEKIGQLFMIRAHSDLPDDHIASVKKQIKEYHVGGLCFFQGTPEKQAKLTREYQMLSRIPLMVAIDAEWGLGMRFKDKGLSFPRQLMLGAIPDVKEIEEMGFLIGKQLKAMGVNVNFAPVADININPLNPVIGDRSFGENKEEVANRSIAYMKGLQSAGVLPCGKHFPGHGDTDTDSHFDLPVIRHDKERLKSVELFPFQKMIDSGMPSVMIAHLYVPALDDETNIASSLSRKTVTGLLKNEMGFKGLVFTDGLEMKGVTKHFKPNEVAVMAFKAGNDILLLPDNMDIAFQGLKKAFNKGELDINELNQRVKQILETKYHIGLHPMVLPDPVEAAKMAFDPVAIGLREKLIEHAITVVQNKRGLIPIINTEDFSYASLAIGTNSMNRFQTRLNDYIDCKDFNAPLDITGSAVDQLARDLMSFKRVIISIHGMNQKPGSKYGLTDEVLRLINRLQAQQDVVVVVFGTPYSLKYFENIEHLIMAYEDAGDVRDIAAQGLMGVFSCNGRLPVGASPIYPAGTGYKTPSLNRMGYSAPERVGMMSDSLFAINNIVKKMIDIKAAPGCEIMIIKDGRIIFDKTFGTRTYQDKTEILPTDLYDLASVTKIAATTISMMKLQEEGKVDIDKTLGDYLPWVRGTNKEKMILRKVMAHHAGLKSWIEFYKRTVWTQDGWMLMQPGVYADRISGTYCIPVAEDMYMNATWMDTIRKQIVQSPLNPDGSYVYSDLGFLMMAEIIQRQTGVTLDKYVDSVFYKPMGLKHIGFNLYDRFPPVQFAPSEEDHYFRCQTLTGRVHDMAAAMLGGVSGHAGLFADARDLATVFQMLMQNGEYGGKKYLSAETINDWTKRYKNSTRRGIGFDMKELNKGKTQLMSYLAPPSTYGHTGFTGICAWNDPDNQLTYIFLSNRTFPRMTNSRMKDNKIREKIHTRAYLAMKGFKPYVSSEVQG